MKEAAPGFESRLRIWRRPGERSGALVKRIRTQEVELDDNIPPRQLTLVVLLYLFPEKRTEFEEFEAAASRIMARYGGRITQRIAPDSTAAGNQPDELHIVHFPDEEAFERYRIDEELAALRDLRSSAIRETMIWRGTQLEPWKSGN